METHVETVIPVNQSKDKIKSFDIVNNPFTDIYVDLTQDCNMRCEFCYNPYYKKNYIQVDYFEEVCKQLPRPVFFRFVGGEPALHPNLPDMIKIVDRYGHKVWIASNGLKYLDNNYIKKLHQVKSEISSGLSLGITLDGGFTNVDAYIKINGGDFLSRKVTALSRLKKEKLGRVTLSAIIVRSLNENVIKELIDYSKNNSDFVRSIHFRTAGLIGKFSGTVPYTGVEIKDIISQLLSNKQMEPKCVGEMHCPLNSSNTCCYRFRPFTRVQISIIEFASEQSTKCPYRGRLLNSGFLVQPFFENIINSTLISSNN